MIDYDALAKQHGGSPQDSDGGVDYDNLSKRFGGNSGSTQTTSNINAPNPFDIQNLLNPAGNPQNQGDLMSGLTRSMTAIPRAMGGAIGAGLADVVAQPEIRGGAQSINQLGGAQDQLIKLLHSLSPQSSEAQKILGLLQGNSQAFGNVANSLGNIASEVPTNKQNIGTGIQAVGQLAALPGGPLASAPLPAMGQGVLKTALSNSLLKTGPMFAAQGFGQGLENNASVGQAAIQGAESYGAGAALSILGSTGKVLLRDGVPKLLSMTSQVPPEAMNEALNDSSILRGNLETNKSNLSDIQAGVRGLRAELSQDYKDGVTGIVDKYSSTRIGLADKESALLEKFGVEVPQGMDLTNISPKESFELYKNINETITPAGIKDGTQKPLVNLARAFKDRMVNVMGGDDGDAAQLLQNYAAKKSVFDNANNLFKAYKTNDSRAMNSALRTLGGAFNDSNTYTLDAIKDLETRTGIPVTKMAAQTQFSSWLPKGSPDLLTNIARTGGILATSPKMAGGIAVGSNFLSKLSNPNMPTSYLTKMLMGGTTAAGLGSNAGGATMPQ